MQYVYPAIFRKDKELPDTWSVEFPDVDGAATCGYSLYEAIREAESALAMVLAASEDKRCTNRVDKPTPLNKVIAESDEFSTEAFATLIAADTDEYRKTFVRITES